MPGEGRYLLGIGRSMAARKPSSGTPAKTSSRTLEKNLQQVTPAGTGMEGSSATDMALFPIVGIGASAGGLEAFEQFFRACPPDTGMAFVLVSHLDPSHESLLTEILQRLTAMPVVQVQDKTRVKPKSIVSPSPFGDIALELAGFNPQGGISQSRAIKSGAMNLSEEGKVLLAALGDLAFNNRGSKIHKATRMVAPDGRTVDAFLGKAAYEMGLAHAAAQQFKDRGGSYEYLSGSSYDMAPRLAQQGENTLSVADPPYYNTTGYKGAGDFSTGDKWNAVGYAATGDLLKTLVDRGNHVLYTDEAWWLKGDQLADKDRADATLAQINNTLSNLTVAPQKVGNRHEQLGIHNPARAVQRAAGAALGQGQAGGRDRDQPNSGGRGDAGSAGGAVQRNTADRLGVGRDVPDSAGAVAGRAGGQAGISAVDPASRASTGAGHGLRTTATPTSWPSPSQSNCRWLMRISKLPLTTPMATCFARATWPTAGSKMRASRSSGRRCWRPKQRLGCGPVLRSPAIRSDQTTLAMWRCGDVQSSHIKWQPRP